jgi:pyroglutamyl-peptidase
LEVKSFDKSFEREINTLPRRVLVTGFEPFGGSGVNASQEAAQRLAALLPDIEVMMLPVVRGVAEQRLLERLPQPPAPSLVLSLGEAGPERVIRLEKVAINWDDFRIPDNAGNQPRDEAIRSDGPPAYFATLPVAALTETLLYQTPLPVTVSLSAGAFLCNHLAYAALDYLADTPLCPYCFVHLPAWRPNDGDAALDEIVQTLQQLLHAAIGSDLPVKDTHGARQT